MKIFLSLLSLAFGINAFQWTASSTNLINGLLTQGNPVQMSVKLDATNEQLRAFAINTTAETVQFVLQKGSYSAPLLVVPMTMDKVLGGAFVLSTPAGTPIGPDYKIELPSSAETTVFKIIAAPSAEDLKWRIPNPPPTVKTGPSTVVVSLGTSPEQLQARGVDIINGEVRLTLIGLTPIVLLETTLPMIKSTGGELRFNINQTLPTTEYFIRLEGPPLCDRTIPSSNCSNTSPPSSIDTTKFKVYQ